MYCGCLNYNGNTVTPFDTLLAHVREHAPCIVADSRAARAGCIFVAVPGAQSDGAAYITAALKAGAGTLVCRPCAEAYAAQAAGATVILHHDPREALWRLAESRYRTASLPVRIVGITGTNGKTTCAYLLEHLFTRLGHTVGVCGTVNYRWPGYCEAAPLTTPDALRLHSMLADMAAAGADMAILEVSSHALDQQRVGGLPFAGALFTNMSQDHLDYHATMDAYCAAKARLFTALPRIDKVCAVNADDAFGRQLLHLCPGAQAFGLSANAGAGLRGTVLSMTPDGVQLEMQQGATTWRLSSPLVGAFNASNLLAVQALALGMGYSPEDMQHLKDFYGVPGRLERIHTASGVNVFVDYAHTPDALVKVLSTLREAGFERIITVFGCGGNRDRSKRPLMGRAVADWADVAVLTSDNPRDESPMAIIEDVLPGLRQSQQRALQIIIEPDRRTATQRALAMLGPRDALCIAGKGHEDYQIIQGIKHPYSDQNTVRELLQCA